MWNLISISVTLSLPETPEIALQHSLQFNYHLWSLPLATTENSPTITMQLSCHHFWLHRKIALQSLCNYHVVTTSGYTEIVPKHGLQFNYHFRSISGLHFRTHRKIPLLRALQYNYFRSIYGLEFNFRFREFTMTTYATPENSYQHALRFNYHFRSISGDNF